jgi:hypothetical protein
VSTTTKVLLLSPLMAAVACGSPTAPSQPQPLYHCDDPRFIPYPQVDGSALVAVECPLWRVVRYSSSSTWTFPAPHTGSKWWPEPPERGTRLRWPKAHVPIPFIAVM